MSRGLGETQFVSDLPDVVVALAGLVTQLGDMWFVLVGIGTIFLGHRAGLSVTDDPWRDCLFLLGLAVGSYSLTLALKHVFLLPRPPGAGTATLPAWLPQAGGPLYQLLVTGDGYGFPSGHALKSTAVYGGAALTLSVWCRRRRMTLAATTIFLVSLSRVVIGVHYVVDVVVGVAVGAAFLAAIFRLGDSRPGPVLGIAVILGVVAFAASFSVNAVLGIGSALAGLAAWTYTRRADRPPAVG